MAIFLCKVLVFYFVGRIVESWKRGSVLLHVPLRTSRIVGFGRIAQAWCAGFSQRMNLVPGRSCDGCGAACVASCPCHEAGPEARGRDVDPRGPLQNSWWPHVWDVSLFCSSQEIFIHFFMLHQVDGLQTIGLRVQVGTTASRTWGTHSVLPSVLGVFLLRFRPDGGRTPVPPSISFCRNQER